MAPAHMRCKVYVAPACSGLRSRLDVQTRRIWSCLAVSGGPGALSVPLALASAGTAPAVFPSLSASKSFKHGRRC